MTYQIVPESAPFNLEQRAWLNGFFAGVLGVLDQQGVQGGSSAVMATAAELLSSPLDASSSNADEPSESFPWHDSGLPIQERMQLAERKPKDRRLMAAMAQLDCGTCGYLCKTYAEAIANGSEKNLSLCSPGGNETAKTIRHILKESGGETVASQRTIPSASERPLGPVGTRENPAVAKLMASNRLNRGDSAKDTRHVVIDLSATPLNYRVGDALGVSPRNCPELVQSVMAAAKLNPQSIVQCKAGQANETHSLAEALAQSCLRTISQDLVDLAMQIVRDRPKHNGSVAIDEQRLQDLRLFSESDEFYQWDVLEFVQKFDGIQYSEQQFVEALVPLRPRLYSIASSQSLFPNEVHLTVGRVVSYVRERKRKGVASTMLSDRLDPGASLRVFVHPSHGFTVPADKSAPMIMVGPGTGIAPFIAFLQQRQVDRATGKNWLFFGDQRRECDYLYEPQLEAWRESGHLTRLDLAFSRDGANKIYVQHLMLEQGREIYEWLLAGGHFYVCGDASRMAADVDRALRDILSKHGKMNETQSKRYLQELTESHRYARDVY
ncbi:MAG: sulfite reductase subunit alpha [Pirellula sp.]